MATTTYTISAIDLLHPDRLSHANNIFRSAGEAATRREAGRIARALLAEHLISEVRITKWTEFNNEPAGEYRRPLTAAEQDEYRRACWSVRRPGEAYSL